MDNNELRLEAQDLNQQGAMLLKTGNVDAAKPKFDKAIELEPMLMEKVMSMIRQSMRGIQE